MSKLLYNFFFYLSNILRKIFKSLGKKENFFQELSIFFKWKKIYLKIKKNNNIDFNFLNYTKNQNNFSDLFPKKVAVCISFYYSKKKIKNLKKVCQNLCNIFEKIDLTIICNKNSLEIQKKIFDKKKKLNIKIYCPSSILHPRLLPWEHVPIMKEKLRKKIYTHFLYLEDDILIKKINITYWLLARKFLKKFKLIPGFIRTELNYNDKVLYSADFLKKDNFNLKPKIFSEKYNIAFTNISYPYCGMYFYDKELMEEHLNGISSNPDYGHGSCDIRYLNPRVINLDLMAKANIGLTYKDVPEGFLNRSIVPVKIQDKIIDDSCLIEHLSNKYTNTKSSYGRIKIKKLFY